MGVVEPEGRGAEPSLGGVGAESEGFDRASLEVEARGGGAMSLEGFAVAVEAEG